jgi:hypothetical protein
MDEQDHSHATDPGRCQRQEPQAALSLLLSAHKGAARSEAQGFSQGSAAPEHNRKAQALESNLGLTHGRRYTAGSRPTICLLRFAAGCCRHWRVW